MIRRLSEFWRREDGATAIEYGLIATFIGLAAITAFANAGTRLRGPFNDVANNLTS